MLAAAGFRLVGIEREPLWLDEIYTHDIGTGGLAETLREVARFDDSKPAYHLGLRAWRGAFGSSTLALRGYSAVWSVLGVGLIFLLGREVGGRSATGLLAAGLAAVNPLDLFFAQEARMYAQAAALTTLSSWVLLRWVRLVASCSTRSTWAPAVGYAVAASLLVSTHYVTVTVLLAQGLFALVFFLRLRAWRDVASYLGCAVGCTLVLAPWLVFVRRCRGEAYSAEAFAWIPEPSATDPLLAVIRDLPWGCAGWPPTTRGIATALSAALLVLVAATLLGGKRRAALDTATRLGIRFAAWLVLAPLALVTAISWTWLPVLYRPRFSLLLLAPFLVVLAVAVGSLTRRSGRFVLAAGLLVAMGVASASQQRATSKRGLGEFAALWRAQGPPDDVLFYPRWNRRVAGFYLGAPVLNVPTRRQLENSLRRGAPRRIWVVRRVGNTMAAEPEEERSLLEWIMALGPRRGLGVVDDVQVTEVDAQPLPPRFPRLCPGVRLRFDEPASEAHLPEGWYRAEKGFRWSRGTRAEVLFALDPPAATELRLEMLCFRRQRITVTLNRHPLAAFECEERAPHLRRFAVPGEALGAENRLLFELPDATSPLAAGVSRDRRSLALGVVWLELR